MTSIIDHVRAMLGHVVHAEQREILKSSGDWNGKGTVKIRFDNTGTSFWVTRRKLEDVQRENTRQ